MSPALNRVLTRAGRRARAGSRLTDTRDLLEALLQERESAAGRVLSDLGMAELPLPDPVHEDDGGRLSQPGVKALGLMSALSQGERIVGTHHLLAGLAREPAGAAGAWLRAHGCIGDLSRWATLADKVETRARTPTEQRNALGWPALMMGLGFALTRSPYPALASFCCVYYAGKFLQLLLLSPWAVPVPPMNSSSCPRCGFASLVLSAFAPATGLCLACQRRSERAHSQRLLAGFAGLLLVTLATLAISPAWGFLFLNLLLIWPLKCLTTVIHESGHALAARLVGFRILSMHLGMGPVVWRKRLAGTWLHLHRIPIGGMIRPLATNLWGYRWKGMVMLAGGPLANLAFAAILWRSGQDVDLARAWTHHLSSGLTLLWLNLSVAVINLYPLEPRKTSGNVGSDGYQMLQSLRGGAPPSARLLQQLSWSAATFFRKDGNYKAALDAIQAGLAGQQPDETTSALLLISLLQCEHYPEALGLARELAERPLEPEIQAIHLNNMAWCYLKMGDLAPADDASRRALELAMPVAAVEGTRGEVLVELGQLEEGKRLLQSAQRRQLDPRSAYLNSLALGRAAALENDWPAFEQQRELAHLLQPEKGFVEGPRESPHRDY
jgi:tetratricopeptide (TPR) repeat protein